MTDTPAEAFARAGQTLREAARVHKRSASAHRRAARRLLQSESEMAELCAALGISYQPGTAKEAQPDGRPSTRPDDASAEAPDGEDHQ